jgi:hypothetical protein
LAVAGFGIANGVPALFSAASRIGPSPSAGIAMAATAGYTGFLSGPPIIGGIATFAGMQAAMFFMAACAAGIALLSGLLPVSDSDVS